MAAVIGPIVAIAQQVNGLLQANSKNKDYRNQWTQDLLKQLSEKNPNKNIMIVCVKRKADFQECVTDTVVCTDDANGGIKTTYTVYVFDSGEFELQGDGGFLNWAFQGVFDRKGTKVTFHKPG